MDPKEMFEAARKAAEDVLAKAKAEGRALTEAEEAEVSKHLDEAERWKAHLENADRAKALFGAALEGEAEPEFGGEAQAKSLGEHVVKAAAEQLKSARRGSRLSVFVPEFKAASDVHVTGGPSGSLGPLLTQVDRVLVTAPRRRLTIADLLAQEVISGSALTYFVESDAIEGSPAMVAENAQKPQVHIPNPTPVTESLHKLAAFIKETDEIIEDLPFLESAINNRLIDELRRAEEDQLLQGNGQGNNIEGLLNRDGVQTEAAEDADDVPDALFRGITKVQTGAGLEADGLVLHPIAYQRLRLAKDKNDQYYGGGFFTGPYGQGGIVEQPPVWGLRTVVTPAIPVGVALVGAFQQGASVVRKAGGGISVDITNSDGNDFQYNRVTIRAEERLLLAVRRPAAFVKVTLTGSES